MCLPKRFLLLLNCLIISLQLSGQYNDKYRILPGEREALQCRFDLIRSARTEIIVSTFIIKDDLIGLSTLQMLVDAAGRGVRVRLIVDDQGNDLPRDLMAFLEEKYVENRIFNIKRYNKYRTVVDRMHGKMMLVDDDQMLLGGRNLKEEYYALDAIDNFLDREVLVHSDSAVNEARLHFYTMWNYGKITGSRKKRLTDARRDYWHRSLINAVAALQDEIAFQLTPNANWLAGVPDAESPVIFIHDNFTRKLGKKVFRYYRKDQACTDAMLELVNQAQYEIDIENAYFIPTPRWMQALRAARKRGVRIRVLTNSAYTNDVPITYAVYRMKRRKYERMGIDLWEYEGKKMLHVKAMVIDGQISLIGSYNLERKSQKFNTEVAAWVCDVNIAEHHLDIMGRNLQRARHISGPQPEGQDLPTPTSYQLKRAKKARALRYSFAILADLVF